MVIQSLIPFDPNLTTVREREREKIWRKREERRAVRREDRNRRFSIDRKTEDGSLSLQYVIISLRWRVLQDPENIGTGANFV